MFAKLLKQQTNKMGLVWELLHGPNHHLYLLKPKLCLKKFKKKGWAWTKISKIKQDELPHFRTKLLAYDMFNGVKPWCPQRNWVHLYLEKEGNPNRAAYQKAMTSMIAKGGDTAIHFCDYITKTNSSYKQEQRGIVVTNMNIYKHDPKNFKVANKPIPIAEIINISCFTGRDQWVIVHTSDKQQDLLFDLSHSSKFEEERCSEFVTVLCEQYKILTGHNLPVNFGDKSSFKGKAKKTINVAFEVTDSPTPSCHKVKKPAPALVLSSPRK